MPVARAVKASAQTAASAPPVEEPAESPATPVPEGTTGQGGDGDSESASPAASSAAKAPQVDDGSATQPGEDAAADLAAAPTQPMEAAGISGTKEDKIVHTQDDMSMSEAEHDEEIVDREPVVQAKATGNGKGTAEVVHRCSRRGQGMAPESDGPPDVPDGGESAAAGLARASRADELDEVEGESEQDSEEEDDDEEDAGDRRDGTGPGGSLAVLTNAAAAVKAKDAKEHHESGVWKERSPTGYKLAPERVAEMDHTNGKAWEVEVWNMIMDPGGGNGVVNFPVAVKTSVCPAPSRDDSTGK